MKNFESLLSDITITKLLNYSGYRLANGSTRFNTYTKTNSAHSFHVFNDVDSDALQVFSTTLYRTLTKTELLFFVCEADSLHTALEALPKIAAFQAQDNNVNISIPISTNTLINLLAELLEADGEILPITKTQQFKRRVFLTSNGYYKSPLFHYQLDQSTAHRIVNFVRWNDTQILYLNTNTYCLNATFYQQTNKYLFITSNPGTWVTFPMLKHSPDYFQLLCHREAPPTMHYLLFNIYKKYAFHKCVFHIGSDQATNSFSCNALSFFINQLYPRFFFYINYTSERYYIQISYNANRDLNIEIAKLFSAVSYDLNQHLFAGMQDEFELPVYVNELASFESEKIEVGEKVTVIESISGQQRVAIVFFNSLLKHLKLDSLEVIPL